MPPAGRVSGPAQEFRDGKMIDDSRPTVSLGTDYGR